MYIADPGHGKIRLSRSDFFKNWLRDGEQGIVLGLEPMPDWEQDAISLGKPYTINMIPYKWLMD